MDGENQSDINMTKKISPVDSLRSLDEITQPDLRNSYFSRRDAHGLRTNTLEDHHADISRFVLSNYVPEGVCIQFETAKNLYLYAWYVYRFYPVAEHQVLACLELGLRSRFTEGLPSNYWSHKGRPPTLKPLLKYAIDSGLISNEGFKVWRERGQLRAEERYRNERLSEMIERGLDKIELNYDEVIPVDQDFDFDYLAVLKDALPGIRNMYAHGHTLLHKTVLNTFRLVMEILEQLYSGSRKEQTNTIVPNSPAK